MSEITRCLPGVHKYKLRRIGSAPLNRSGNLKDGASPNCRDQSSFLHASRLRRRTGRPDPADRLTRLLVLLLYWRCWTDRAGTAMNGFRARSARIYHATQDPPMSSCEPTSQRMHRPHWPSAALPANRTRTGKRLVSRLGGVLRVSRPVAHHPDPPLPFFAAFACATFPDFFPIPILGCPPSTQFAARESRDPAPGADWALAPR